MRGACFLPLAALAAALTLAACAPMTHVVLLPQTGHDSTVEITARVPAKNGMAAGSGSAASGVRTTLLTKPYQAAAVGAGNRLDVQQWNADRVKSRYGALLAAQPPAMWDYMLYFQFNGTRLTPESAARLDQVIEQALARQGNEIVVTGYADSVGTTAANDLLSLQRARLIRQAIIARGFNPARVYAVGRGARNPLVVVGDQTAEQRNRRVEITVR